MARRRDQSLDLNFDGLTDTLTNLVGTLILLVFILMGITHEPSPELVPPDIPAVGFETPAAAKTSSALQEQVVVLQTILSQLDRQIEQYETSIPELEKKLEDLIRRAQNRPPAKPAAPKSSTKGTIT